MSVTLSGCLVLILFQEKNNFDPLTDVDLPQVKRIIAEDKGLFAPTQFSVRNRRSLLGRATGNPLDICQLLLKQTYSEVNICLKRGCLVPYVNQYMFIQPLKFALQSTTSAAGERKPIRELGKGHGMAAYLCRETS